MGEDRFQRNATLLWAAQFVSGCGDALFLPCLAWLAGRTGSGRADVGNAVFLAYLPWVLVGPVAGAWVDRVDRRGVMVLSDLLRAVLLGALPLYAGWCGGVGFGLVVAVGVLLATLSTPFLPARDALLPELVGARSLARWNAVMQSSGQLAMIVGLVLGGLLMQGAAGGRAEIDRVVRVLQLDGATFLVSGLLLARIVRARGRARPPRRTHLLRDALDGLRHAGQDPGVVGLLVLTALNNLAIMGPAVVGAALLVQDTLRLGPGHYAWFEGCMAAGMLVGSLVLALRGRRVSMRAVLLGGMVLDGVTYLPFLVLPDYFSMLPMIAVHGIFIPFIVVGRTSLVQALVPSERHGKVFALVNLTVVGMTAISAWACGHIAAVWGPRVLFGLAGTFGALSGLGGLWLWRPPRARAVRPSAAPDPRPGDPPRCD